MAHNSRRREDALGALNGSTPLLAKLPADQQRQPPMRPAPAPRIPSTSTCLRRRSRALRRPPLLQRQRRQRPLQAVPLLAEPCPRHRLIRTTPWQYRERELTFFRDRRPIIPSR